jgi:peptidoglycan/LPS O-acetylase OafA/YrhL
VRHRDDIQGLRAIAVLLVVLGHAGVPLVAGGFVGVDVFFVLSGYLITGLLLADALENGRVSLVRFYVRRARRILPAAALTLVATMIAAHHLLNFVRARDVVHDSMWAAFFAANSHFAAEGADYFQQGQPPSPIQHFWSLSVEEQFYFVWPTLLGLALFGLVRRRASRARLLLVIGAVGTASLAWSIHATADSRATAYFSTATRAWELALGAALAVATPFLAHVPGSVRIALGWAGIAAIACAAAVFSSATAFPGYAALLPTLGAAAVIASVEHHAAVGRPLSLRPFRFVGDRSYALYLWHWPVLVIAAGYAGHSVSLGVKLGLVAFAFALSVVSYALVEDPLRRLRWPAPVGSLAWPASAAAVVGVALLISGSINDTARRIEAAAASVKPPALVDTAAAASRLERPPDAPLPPVVAAVRAAEDAGPIPSPLTPPVGSLRDDFYKFPNGCTPRGGATKSKVCRLGDASASKIIVVFGDSHAQMWMPTVLDMAQRDSWVVIPFVKVSCIPRMWFQRTGQCPTWYRWATKRASALRPDVTLIMGSWANTWSPPRAIQAVSKLSARMRGASRSVIVMDDPPGQTVDPTDCLLDSHSTMRTCSRAQTKTQQRTSAAIAANARRQHVGLIKSRGWFCAPTRNGRRILCPLVINQTITYVDRGHVSKTYAQELDQPFRVGFRAALFGAFGPEF